MIGSYSFNPQKLLHCCVHPHGGRSALATGTLQLFKVKAEGAVAPPGVYGITHLGYPIYFLTILGVWKILGVVAVLIPKFPLLKEWAYAGFFFAMSGAIFSHIASGDSVKEIFPSLLLLILTMVSWYFRPADRKIDCQLTEELKSR
jgi:hypothetical protein